MMEIHKYIIREGITKRVYNYSSKCYLFDDKYAKKIISGSNKTKPISEYFWGVRVFEVVA